MYKKYQSLLIFTLLVIIGFTGCVKVPGETREDQVITIDQLVKSTLEDLYEQNPKTKEEIASSVGYAVFSNKITKVPIVGAGSGYGVAIHNKSATRAYLKMARFDVGGGWGARSVRPVIIFHNEQEFNDLINGKWEAQIGAEAAAKIGEVGAAGSGNDDNPQNDKGYTVHMITDAGVSATVTAGLIRIAPITLKD